MKSFILLIVVLIIFCCVFPHFDFMKKTRTGVVKESFESLNSSSLPPILKTYFINNNIRFELYTIPNHVKDLFTFNSDFSSVYRNKSKYSIILVEPQIENLNFKLLCNKIKDLSSSYPHKYNLIYKYEGSVSYPNPYDTQAVKDLMEHCKYFCLIDPQNETLFTFRNLTATEVESVEAILQQYADIIK